MYIYEHPNWPHFTWDKNLIATQLAELRLQQGRLLGRMDSLAKDDQQEATLQSLTDDVMKSSQIEGILYDPDQVRSSLAKRMGIVQPKTPGMRASDEGIVEVQLDATRNYAQPLTEERLLHWHKILFPTGKSGLHTITVGAWRGADSEMQVVSGPPGHETVHYTAPDAKRVPRMMDAFFTWFNRPDPGDPVLQSAIAHLYFVTIHPLEDGNGRIARALADLLLARSEQSLHRYYSMSAQIQRDRANYYAMLQRTQDDDLNITPWLSWYFERLKHSITSSTDTLNQILAKSSFWKTHGTRNLNDRQRHMLNRLLDGFTGKLTTTKWAQLTKCSHDTAFRDIDDLIDKGILEKDEAGGRSTSYRLANEKL